MWKLRVRNIWAIPIWLGPVEGKELFIDILIIRFNPDAEINLDAIEPMVGARERVQHSGEWMVSIRRQVEGAVRGEFGFEYLARVKFPVRELCSTINMPAGFIPWVAFAVNYADSRCVAPGGWYER